ncbi:hypothetical protein M422DRAFT_243455 [Sphaerobolus stellatus SS14]|nr:hypothetical protein M422DRAFT_243455 [Sphaerobolus stellatus SS14]
MSNRQNQMSTAPNAPRIRCIPLPDVYPPTHAPSGQQVPQNALLSPPRRSVPRNAPVAPRPAPTPIALPPNAPRMRPIPLPDV